MLINDYKVYLKDRSAKNTVDAYMRDINQMITMSGRKSLKTINRYDLENWVRCIKDKDEASTVNRKITAIQGFYKWLNKEHGYSNISNDLARPKIMKVQKVALTDNQVDSIIISSSNNIKYKTLILFGSDAGTRINEPLKLKLSDINFETGTMRILDEKTHRIRLVPMSEDLKESLMQYVEEYKITDGKLFNMTKNGVRKGLKKIFEDAGVVWGENKGFTYHSFKHYFVTSADRNGISLKVISELVGTSTKVLEEIYLHPSDDDKMNAINKMSSRRRNI